MKLPIQITFRNVDESESIKRLIIDEAESLDHYFARIMGCRVLVEKPHHHHKKGSLFHVVIDLTLPGKELVVRRGPEEHAAHTDPHLTVRDAFREMRRQIQDYVRKRRGEIKEAVRPAHAKVSRLPSYEDYGFLETSEGREIYFHKNSLLNEDFQKLRIGDEVRFHEEFGEKGPQASSVQLIGKEGRREFPIPTPSAES